MNTINEVRLWKPADVEFTADDKANIALALGMSVDDVQWSESPNEIVEGVVGHALIARNFTASP